jgi:hypothetical protein
MSDRTIGQTVDRRSFLRGSALFAAAFGLAAAPAGAQQPQQPPPPKPDPEEGEEKPADPFEEGKSSDGKLYDKEGREYRVCPQCAYNMYKQGRMWVCENCGYSYVE